jgi:hypothetical protein
METVHGHRRRHRPEPLDEQAGQRRFAGAGRPGDAQYGAPAGAGERPRPRRQS